MNQLACRSCRRPLLAETGCAVCHPWRAHFVVVGETEDERPSLATVASEAVSGLRAQLRHYRGELRRELDPDDKERALALERTLAVSLAKLLDSARKIQTDGIAAIERMSFAERAELFIEWYLSLPPPYRTKLRSEMETEEIRLLGEGGGEPLELVPGGRDN